jgi:hypothetical protein
MIQFRQQMQKQLDKMAATGKLFRANINGYNLWDVYLDSFDHDPIFRDPESSVHNCNHCNNFIRRYGNIIAVNDKLEIMTLYDFVPIEDEFIPVALAMQKAVKKAGIGDAFVETFNNLKDLPYESCKKTAESFKLGIDKNIKRYTKEEADLYGVVKPNEIRTFEHMSLQMPRQFIRMDGGSIEAITGAYRDAKHVFERGMKEISLDTLQLVKDLIQQGSLLDGTTHLKKIEAMIPLKKEYDNLPGKDRETWCWVASYGLMNAKFKNSLIGVLCTELSEGMELNKACENWNKRVDPANYMKATAPITKKQIQEAKLFVEDNGYEASFKRRPATIDDIKADEILHLNGGDGEIAKVSIFDDVKSTSTRHKRSEFDGVEEVSIDKFMKDILPGCTSIEAFLKNHHENHMMTLTTADTDDSKPIFKWPNNYSWTFNGNLAGKSMIKEAVKLAGGAIDGVLNFRLAWNDSDGRDGSDLDAWALEPSGKRIGFNSGFRKDRGGNPRSPNSGQLDVDNTNPRGKLAVENITWNDQRKMQEGIYKVWVNQYSANNSQGFKVEIEFDGHIYEYTYDRAVRGNVQVAEIQLKDGEFAIRHILKPTNGTDVSREFYGLETNHFHQVNLICLSPNHWGGSEVGNKYYFFMLDGAKSPTAVRGFHNENLNSELVKHRKVMEVLANTTMVEPSPKELSGLGFNSTVRDELILRLKGSHKRVIKVKF